MKAAGAANVRLMEKFQTLRSEIDALKEYITQLTKLTLYDSDNGGELEPKLEAAIKEKEHAITELQKVQEELQTLGDARLILYGAKL